MAARRRWIFGLALVPTALLMLASLDTAGDAGALEWIAVTAIAYLGSLVAIALLAGLVIAGIQFVSRARHFIAELLGLRG